MKKLMKSKRGDGYIDVVIAVLVSMMLLVMALNIFSFFTLKQDLDYFTKEMLEVATAEGRTNGEVYTRYYELADETGIYPSYDYTIINNEDLITGAQMKWRGYSDWACAANATIGGLTQYYTIDYRNIKSTNPNDRDEYLTSLVYWTGESAHMDICEYMKNAVNHKIISTASVVTDSSLTYNNGVQLIRARVFVTWQSGADYYGLKNGVKYYKDVEVAVYRSNGEDRYGFGMQTI